MKKILTTVLILTFTISGLVYAEGGKTGYVDVARVFDDYEKTKDNDRILQEAGRKKEEERDALVHEVRQIKDELLLLDGDAKNSKQEKLEKKVEELQNFDRDAKNELGQQRSEIVREIFQDIDSTVQEYGEKKGYDFIFNEKAMIYSNPANDATDDVLKELNKKYTKR
ncbi:MAG: OmpH family outer membrane protein [Candidatus Omnitrophica bacterium]|nr:OmpH family outer membrane protein [Candidatus Omnitrophota bacterium]